MKKKLPIITAFSYVIYCGLGAAENATINEMNPKVESACGIESTKIETIDCNYDSLEGKIQKCCVDFRTSMGQGDPYMQPFYDMILTNKVEEWWINAVGDREPVEVFSFFEKMYEQNKLKLLPDSEPYRIPRVFHHIWIGGKPFPEKYKKWQKTWQSVPGWEYKLWTDREVRDFPMVNRDLFEAAANIGIKADILRMEILYKEGGVYIDTDFECLQPEMFDILNKNYDFYSGLTPLDGKAILIANGLIGAISGHPILKGYIENLRKAKTMKGCTGIVMKGPGFLTRMVLEYANTSCKDILLPPTFFYPLAIYPPKPIGLLSLKQGSLAHLMDSEEGREEIKYIVNKPESLAIHWWEGSWVVDDGKPIC